MTSLSKIEKEFFYNCLEKLPKIFLNKDFINAYELNQIFKFFPEFKKTMLRKQHKIHRYTIGVHSLKVMAEIYQNPVYKLLNTDEKRALLICALFHDIEKDEGIVDKSHPEKSARTASILLKRLNLFYYEEEKIINLIKTHNWLEIMDKSDSKEQTAKEYAKIFATKQMLNLSKIFCEADLKAVNNEFFTLFGNQIEEFAPMIEKYLGNSAENQI